MTPYLYQYELVAICAGRTDVILEPPFATKLEISFASLLC